MIIRADLTKQTSQVTLTEDHEVIEALGSDRLHESLRMGIAVPRRLDAGLKALQAATTAEYLGYTTWRPNLYGHVADAEE